MLKFNNQGQPVWSIGNAYDFRMEGEGGTGGEGEGDKNKNNEGGGEFDLAKALSNPKSKAVLEEWAEREIARGLKSKNQDLLDTLNQFKIKDEKGNEVKITPKDAVEAILKVRSGKGGDEELQRALDAQKERHDAEVAAIRKVADDQTKRADQEQISRHNYMIGKDLQAGLLDSGIKVGKMHLHEQYLKSFLIVDNENGKERIVVKDEMGKIRYGSSGIMTLREFIEEYKGKDGVAEDWNSNNRSGSGSNPNNNNGNPNIPSAAYDMKLTPEARLKAFRQGGSK